MEKHVNKKTEDYVIEMKTNLRRKIMDLNFCETEKTNDLIEYLNEYERLVFAKGDFVKRNRLQKSIPHKNRCNAKLQNGEQCTRRKKSECSFCGTHTKNVPYGSVEIDPKKMNMKVDVFAVEVKGIVFYIDGENNVFKTEDILEEKENPAVIAKAVFNNGVYCIPDLNI